MCERLKVIAALAELSVAQEQVTILLTHFHDVVEVLQRRTPRAVGRQLYLPHSVLCVPGGGQLLFGLGRIILSWFDSGVTRGHNYRPQH